MPATSSAVLRRRVVALALEPVARAAEILDRVAQLVADVVVGRDARRDAHRLVVAHQLAVELVRGANALKMSPRSFSSDIARSTYGLMLSAARTSVDLGFRVHVAFLSRALSAKPSAARLRS